MEKQEYFDYLMDLRDSGVTNMFGAPAYLQRDFCLSVQEAREIFLEWIKTFDK